MEHKQKEQLKKVLVFAGLGIIFALAMWFIFAPATKEQPDAGEGLNDNIPQATTEKLTENKLKAYELVDHTTQEEQAREEVGRLSEYFQQEATRLRATRRRRSLAIRLSLRCNATRRTIVC